MSLVSQTVRMVERYGVLEFYLPFVLTFCVFYALLRKSKVFGEEAKTINAIISVVAAFYVIAYTPIGFRIGGFLSRFFTRTTIVMVGLMGIGLILAFGIGIGWKPKCWVGKLVITLTLLVVGIIVFFSSGGFGVFGRIPPTVGILSVEDVFFFTLIGLTVLIILLVTGWVPKPCPTPQPQQQGG